MVSASSSTRHQATIRGGGGTRIDKFLLASVDCGVAFLSNFFAGSLQLQVTRDETRMVVVMRVVEVVAQPNGELEPCQCAGPQRAVLADSDPR